MKQGRNYFRPQSDAESVGAMSQPEKTRMITAPAFITQKNRVCREVALDPHIMSEAFLSHPAIISQTGASNTTTLHKFDASNLSQPLLSHTQQEMPIEFFKLFIAR